MKQSELHIGAKSILGSDYILVYILVLTTYMYVVSFLSWICPHWSHSSKSKIRYYFLKTKTIKIVYVSKSCTGNSQSAIRGTDIYSAFIRKYTMQCNDFRKGLWWNNLFQFTHRNFNSEAYLEKNCLSQLLSLFLSYWIILPMQGNEIRMKDIFTHFQKCRVRK